jgi:hypothetical protein
MRSTARFVAIASLVVIAALAAFTAVSAQQGGSIPANLTPFGGERAGNAAWDGGITKPPAGYTPGRHYVDPFAADKPLFTITQQNADQYAAGLSEGHKAMLKTYPTFKMNVYPSRRSASAPQRIYDATAKNVATAKLVNNGNGVEGAIGGPPFPMPKVGAEVIWNHLLRYRGDNFGRWIAQAAPTRGGQFTVVNFEEETLLLYALPTMTPATLANRVAYFKQTVTAPARLAGGILLVHETLDQVKKPRDAWLYNPG